MTAQCAAILVMTEPLMEDKGKNAESNVAHIMATVAEHKAKAIQSWQ